MSNFEVLWHVFPKVALIAVPILVVAAFLHPHFFDRDNPAKNPNTIERSVDVERRASSATIAQLEAEGFTFSRIRRGRAYFVKDRAEQPDRTAGGE
jgi:hypothetical protein